MQPRIHLRGDAVQRIAAAAPVTYMIFDVLSLGDRSLMELPYTARFWETESDPAERRKLLTALFDHMAEGRHDRRRQAPGVFARYFTANQSQTKPPKSDRKSGSDGGRTLVCHPTHRDTTLGRLRWLSRTLTLAVDRCSFADARRHLDQSIL